MSLSFCHFSLNIN